MSPRSSSSSSSSSSSYSSSSSSSSDDNDYSYFPKVIHITEATTSASKSTSTSKSTIHSPPRHILCTPPPKGLRRGGILKNSSYMMHKYNDGREGGGTVSTPTTVGTNESYDISSSNNSCCDSSCNSSSDILNTSFTSTLSVNTADINAAAERIIINATAATAAASTTPPRSSLNNNVDGEEEHYSCYCSPSSSPSTSTSSSSSSSKEEMQRCARIKHIEDLNERINAAKTRAVVEKKVFKKENKLMLRLARQLKSTSKKNMDNTMELQELEETNQRLEEYWIQTHRELHDLKSSRLLLEESLRIGRERRLVQDQHRRDDILRDQSAQLELLNTNHQFRCQDLCESVLEANSELNRLRSVVLQLNSSSSMSKGKDGKEQIRIDEEEEQVIEKGEQQQTPRQQSRSLMLILMLIATVVIVVLAITATTTTTTTKTLIGEDNGEQQTQQSIVIGDLLTATSAPTSIDVFQGPMMSNSCSIDIDIDIDIDSNEGDNDNVDIDIDAGTETTSTKTRRKRLKAKDVVASVARLVDIYNVHIQLKMSE